MPTITGSGDDDDDDSKKPSDNVGQGQEYDACSTPMTVKGQDAAKKETTNTITDADADNNDNNHDHDTETETETEITGTGNTKHIKQPSSLSPETLLMSHHLKGGAASDNDRTKTDTTGMNGNGDGGGDGDDTHTEADTPITRIYKDSSNDDEEYKHVMIQQGSPPTSSE
jgi:hypothetical protein